MVKEKINSIRTYDDDGFKRRAACLCVRDETETEVLLVSGSKDPDRWVVPGGGIEPTEDTEMAAEREAQEEAGVKGTLGRCLGMFENPERKTRTSVFVLVVKEQYDDWEDRKTIGRRRQWFSLAEGMEQLALHKPVQKSYLELLCPKGLQTSPNAKSPKSNSGASSSPVPSSSTPPHASTNNTLPSCTDTKSKIT